MNRPDASNEPIDRQRRNRNRALLLAIFVLFLGSLFVAGALRFSGWRPSGMKNKGELLQPPADLRALSPTLREGGPYAWDPAARTWRIAVAPPAGCGAECAQVARDVHKVWELLGREARRVDVLWLCPDAVCTLDADASTLPRLRVLRADDALRTRLPGVDALAAPGGRRGVPVYVVDPNGFVILRYPAGADLGGLRADLSKLLKLK